MEKGDKAKKATFGNQPKKATFGNQPKKQQPAKLQTSATPQTSTGKQTPSANKSKNVTKRNKSNTLQMKSEQPPPSLQFSSSIFQPSVPTSILDLQPTNTELSLLQLCKTLEPRIQPIPSDPSNPLISQSANNTLFDVSVINSATQSLIKQIYGTKGINPFSGDNLLAITKKSKDVIVTLSYNNTVRIQGLFRINS